MRLCLFEDGVENLAPLSLTRPAFELRCGSTTLADKQRRHFSLPEWGVIVRPCLKNLYRLQERTVPINDGDWLGAGPVVLVNGRWLPPAGTILLGPQPRVGLVNDEVAYVILSQEQAGEVRPEDLPPSLEDWRTTLPARDAGGRMIDYPWDLVENNGTAIGEDFVGLSSQGQGADRVHLVGPTERLSIDRTASIDPLVVADTTGGPVVIQHNARVHAFTRLEGPCVIGPNAHILGAKIRGGTTIGPHCRVGGEVEASILHGYVNKYHDGFLGHSYLGEWVNLGAGTYNSDLRNDYGDVTVKIAGQDVATGLTKVGCFLGDHTKTGLGTMINTGTNVGVFCNLFPAGRFAPKHVPSFMNWWKGELQEGLPIERLLHTARIVMQRRGAFLTSEHVVLYRQLLEETAAERQRALNAPRTSPRRQAA